jgi:hypothetical protein
MIGYWSENCPVTTSDPKVLATVYKKPNAALISIASWADNATTVDIKIDFTKLGLDPLRCTAYFPEVNNFQSFTITPAMLASLKKGIIPSVWIDKAKGAAIIIKSVD